MVHEQPPKVADKQNSNTMIGAVHSVSNQAKTEARKAHKSSEMHNIL